MGRNRPDRPKISQGPEREIARVAARQHGNITRVQLLALGLSDKETRWRVARGLLFRVHHGVYAVGRPPVMPLERAAAAVLACGRHAGLSHLSSLALWDLRRTWPRTLEVTIAVGDRRPPNIIVHRSRTLARRDVTNQRGIRTTSPARAILDCAPRLTNRGLRRAVNDARHQHILTPGQLIDVVSRNPTHPGAKRVAHLVRHDRGPTRSEFEDRFGALCDRYHLPAPMFGQWVGGWETDAYFPQPGLIIELDGWDFHQDRCAFESDRLRDADHLEDGIPTLRITWERLDQTPDREAARVHRILDRLDRGC